MKNTHEQWHAGRGNLFGILLCLAGSFAASAGQETDSSIELLSPKGDESFTVGQTMVIRWTIHNSAEPGGGLALAFSPNEGFNWVVIVNEIIKNKDPAFYIDSAGSFSWTIPDSIKLYGNTYAKVRGNQCQIMAGAPYDGVFAPSYSNNFTVGTAALVLDFISKGSRLLCRNNAPDGASARLYTIDGKRCWMKGIRDQQMAITLKSRVVIK
jgi:hypothetical protein